MQLLSLDACPPSVKIYGHLYASDALCHLSRSAEAMEHMTAAIALNEHLLPVVSCTGADLPPPPEGNPDGGVAAHDCVRNPYSPLQPGGKAASKKYTAVGSASKAMLYTNLAVVSILRGESDAAPGYVAQALEAQPDQRQALLCSIYLELKAGHNDVALELIYKFRRPVPK